MIAGTGIDLVELARMEQALKRPSFAKRVFTEEERRQAAGSIRRFAGDFAVKEAVAKAMGTGVRGFGPQDIACIRNALGAPEAVLSGRAAALAKSLGITRFHISITNTKVLAAAVAVAEREDGRVRDAGMVRESGMARDDEPFLQASKA